MSLSSFFQLQFKIFVYVILIIIREIHNIYEINEHENYYLSENMYSYTIFVGCRKIFCAPDQIGKTKRSGSDGTGSFKNFQNTFESLGFIHINV